MRVEVDIGGRAAPRVERQAELLWLSWARWAPPTKELVRPCHVAVGLVAEPVSNQRRAAQKVAVGLAVPNERVLPSVNAKVIDTAAQECRRLGTSEVVAVDRVRGFGGASGRDRAEVVCRHDAERP